MADPESRVVAVVQALTGGKPLTIDSHASLFDAGILDSFALPELVAALEREFGMKIPDRDLSAQTFESISRIAAYVLKRA